MNTNIYINNNIINSINKLINIKDDLIKLKDNNYNTSLNIYNNLEFIKNLNIEYYKNNNFNKQNLLIIIIFDQLYLNNDKYIIYNILEK